MSGGAKVDTLRTYVEDVSAGLTPRSVIFRSCWRFRVDSVVVVVVQLLCWTLIRDVWNAGVRHVRVPLHGQSAGMYTGFFCRNCRPSRMESRLCNCLLYIRSIMCVYNILRCGLLINLYVRGISEKLDWFVWLFVLYKSILLNWKLFWYE